MTVLFLDTEFTGLQQNTTIVSLALVGKNLEYSFYAEFTDYDKGQLNQWLIEHVVKSLIFSDFRPDENHQGMTDRKNKSHIKVMGTKEYVAKALQKWLIRFEKVTIAADVLAYDWVLFCELFGGAMNLPIIINPYPLDLATLLFANGIDPHKSRKDFLTENQPGAAYYMLFTPAFKELEGLTPQKMNHNAFFDACVGMICWQALQKEKITIKAG